MHAHPMILITAVCEESLVPRLIEVLQRCGATGYTLTPAQGRSFGLRDKEVQRQVVQVVVPHEEADHILEEIHQRNLHDGSFILWTTEVKVLRRGRFVA
ncbi:MAG: hypothetical protein NZ481_09870 [Candidatus Kapabacteria bacterium]|nr:hypothetical protein [Candidatus Kapabacteria bacterium]